MAQIGPQHWETNLSGIWFWEPPHRGLVLHGYDFGRLTLLFLYCSNNRRLKLMDVSRREGLTNFIPKTKQDMFGFRMK